MRLTQIRIGRQKFGFTMVEMLVVITVIVVMMGISVPAYVGMRKGLRDNQRIEDMKRFQTQLEEYFGSMSQYQTYSNNLCCLEMFYVPGSPFYPTIPKDPLTNCSSGNKPFASIPQTACGLVYPVSTQPEGLCYYYGCREQRYCVCAKMEVAGSGNSTGINCDFDGAGDKNYFCVSNQQGDL